MVGDKKLHFPAATQGVDARDSASGKHAVHPCLRRPSLRSNTRRSRRTALAVKDVFGPV